MTHEAVWRAEGIRLTITRGLRVCGGAARGLAPKFRRAGLREVRDTALLPWKFWIAQQRIQFKSFRNE